MIHVDRYSNAETLRCIMQKLIDRHGPPQYMSSDNGSVPRSEATTCEAIYSKRIASFTGGDENHNRLYPTSKPLAVPSVSDIFHGFVESFHARFREQCLNRQQLCTLTEAGVVIEDWCWLYNHVRARPSLDFLYPLNFNINLSTLTLPVDQFA